MPRVFFRLDLRILKNPLFSIAVGLIIVHSFVLCGTGVLNPVFLQEFMGYSAWRAGLVLCPRALGAMAAMLLAGQIARAGYDNKRLIGPSFAVMALGLWMMAHWSLGVGTWQVIWPGVVLASFRHLLVDAASSRSTASAARPSLESKCR